MDKDKLKELVLKHLAELLDEDGSSTAGVPGYLGIKAFKPKYETADKVFNRNPARPLTAQDKNAPTGFEKMPKSGDVYKKMGFRIVKPSERIDAKDLWKGQHLEERIGYATPKAFVKTKKQHETSKSGHEDLPNPDKHFELVKFKIVDPKKPKKVEEQLNESTDIPYYKPIMVAGISDTPNSLRVMIKYPEGVGHLAQYGATAISDEEKEYRVKKAMQVGELVISKLQSKYNIENIDMYDNENGKVIITATSDDFINIPKPSLNEVRYSQFKSQSKNRTPQEQLHMGVKEIQRKLDEINKLVEFTSRMKTELKGDADQMNYLKRTHNALFKINTRIQDINNKIKGLTE
jgi:hypothetical protein